MDQNGPKKRCMYCFWQRNTYYCIAEHSVMLQRISVSYSALMASDHPNVWNMLRCTLLQHNSVKGPLPSEIITSELKADWSLWVSASSLLFAVVVMKK